MKPGKPRRIHYHPEVYAKLLKELTQLLNAIPYLKPSRDEWDLEGDFSKAGSIRFVDMNLQHHFIPFANFDCRTIKLVNLGKPAVRMHFSMTHRYWLLKDVELSTPEKQERIQVHINELYVEIDKLQAQLHKKNGASLTKAQALIGQYTYQVQIWSQILLNLSDYELSVSNYSRNYYYLTINYKYWDDPADEYKNEPVHLLNNQRDKSGNITQYRHNIVFVDTQEILRDHPYQNKTIEKYLARFDLVTQVSRDQIYARRRLEIDSTTAFADDETKPSVQTELESDIGRKSRKATKKGKQPQPIPLFDQKLHSDETDRNDVWKK